MATNEAKREVASLRAEVAGLNRIIEVRRDAGVCRQAIAAVWVQAAPAFPYCVTDLTHTPLLHARVAQQQMRRSSEELQKKAEAVVSSASAESITAAQEASKLKALVEVRPAPATHAAASPSPSHNPATDATRVVTHH